MRYGITMPAFGAFAEPSTLLDLARTAEAVGWDGFFLWDAVIHDASYIPMAEPWTALTAIAMATQRVKLGIMITPLPRRRPWQVARQATTVDRLSNGRLIFGAGLGGGEADFSWFGDTYDPKERAVLLDEGLEIVTQLWTGQPAAYHGTRYQLEQVAFRPTPLQQPRIPIWIAGMWPNKAPMRRAARYDGVFPLRDGFALTPVEFAALKQFVDSQRTAQGHFDYVASGITAGDDPAAGHAQVMAYTDVGATWWLETVDPWSRAGNWATPFDAAAEEWMAERIRQGPPRV